MSDMTDERALDFIRTYLAPYAAHGEKDLVVEHIAARLRAAPQPPAEAQGGGEASEGWHAALDSASELVSNAPDARYRKRAEQVRDWIKARPDTPPSAPVGVERLVSNAIAYGKRLQWPAVMATLERLRGTLALAQQPAAVDEAMAALLEKSAALEKVLPVGREYAHAAEVRAFREALTAALAAQQGGES